MTEPIPAEPPFIPDTYRLLAVFNLIPLKSLIALEFAELRQAGDSLEISDAHRALLRRLSNEGRIRWVE
ncbi:hypothetical protein E7T06_11335 [Deinococcus sp. Arct2-2]|uniref:hypothetical protein n=1 Tax=Deinococcus sp. Arct2-2 TaxID=2568653 RepID=UPI0010A4E44A|nr:hypothetical protein [Deinococcus sp. Arct2-2]THF69601.1 hypothetical protein E7T06_11335 [Deinococcus sp. Arct2-2]